MSYHVEAIPNRNRRPTILLRKAWREGKRIRKKTLANLTCLPPGMVEGIRRVVKGGVAFERPDEAFQIRITPDGRPVNSMCTLLDHLGSLTLNQIALAGNLQQTFNVATEPTPLQ